MLNLDLHKKGRHFKNGRSMIFIIYDIVGLNSRSLKLKYILERQSKLDFKDKISNINFDRSPKILKMQGNKVKTLRKGNLHDFNNM